MGLIGKAKVKLGRMAMNQIIGVLLKKAAEGDFGPAVQKLYVLVDGHKTQMGALLALPGIVLLALDQSGSCTALALNCHGWATTWGTTLTALGAFGIHIGQVGGALKMEPPK